MKKSDDIITRDWLAALERHDRRSDLRDALIAFVVAVVCFGALWASAAEPQRASSVDVVDVQSGRLVQADGGVVDITGGAWVSEDVLLTTSRRIVLTEAELAALKKAPAPPASTPLVVISNIATGVLQTIGAAMTACYVGTGNVVCLKR